MTLEMKAIIRRMDENAVAPRLIWSKLLRAPQVPKPVMGYPSHAQVHRSAKHIRWLHGAKNSIVRVRELVRQKTFVADIDANAAFVFGNREGDDGFPFVDNEEDEQPLLLGRTTMNLLHRILKLQEQEAFLLFHMDVTFKLSDLGNPVITCGFADMRLVYQMAGMFIVSQWTEGEYDQAIGTLAKVFQKHMKAPLRIDAVMGDAESAQHNALGKIVEFENCRYLMCFFHVLYNARKRIRHLPDSLRAMVYRGILDMHYALSKNDLVSIWSRVVLEWRNETRLWGFVDYFNTQWLCSRFWRWQIHHSPGGFATTNNPCEVFNASIKRYTLRKAVYTWRLFLKLLTIAEDSSVAIPPTIFSVCPPPPQVAKKLAKVLG